MAYKDLHEFMNVLDEMGELHRVTTLVDPELEITEITDRVSKSGGPALLFENVKGSAIPLLINAFGSRERMAISLQVEDLDQIGDEITTLLQLADNVPGSLLGKVKMLPQLAQLSSYFPKIVRSGSCQEVVHMEPDLGILPVLKCWPEDAGKFITLP